MRPSDKRAVGFFGILVVLIFAVLAYRLITCPGCENTVPTIVGAIFAVIAAVFCISIAYLFDKNDE